MKIKIRSMEALLFKLYCLMTTMLFCNTTCVVRYKDNQENKLGNHKRQSVILFLKMKQCRGLTGGFLMFRNFSDDISVSPPICFILVLILISMFLRQCIYELGIVHANQTTKCLRNQGKTKGEGWSTAN